MILETRHLRLVAAVAEHGTLTRAGRVLHLTQSGLSRQLLDLETRLGLPLFQRLGKRMVPTPAGERLLVAARRALPQLSDVEEDLRRLAGGRAAILRVSTESTRSAPSRSSPQRTSRISTCSSTCCRRVRTTSSRSS